MATVTNLDEIVDAGLGRVQDRIRIQAAYLFGSQLAGEADADSDIDLAVFSPDLDGLNLVERVHLSSEISVRCDSRLELHLYSSRALANARPTNFAGYIVSNGKRLV
jgi:predicted nucleotidyltransferase